MNTTQSILSIVYVVSIIVCNLTIDNLFKKLESGDHDVTISPDQLQRIKKAKFILTLLIYLPGANTIYAAISIIAFVIGLFRNPKTIDGTE